MSDSKHVDESADNVAIAAQTTLDAAREADESERTKGDAGSDQIHLIMGALEKLATATDQMAQQLTQRLDVVREGFTQDLDAARVKLDETQKSGLKKFEQVASTAEKALQESVLEARGNTAAHETSLRKAIAEGLDDLLDHTDKKIQSHLGRFEERVRGRLEEIEQGLRDDLSKGRERIDEAIESLNRQLGERLDAMQSAQESTYEELARRQDEALASLREDQGQVFERLDQEQRAQRDALEQRAADLGERIDARAHALREHVDRIREELREDVGSLRGEIQKMAADVASLVGALDQNREAIERTVEASREEIVEQVQETRRSLEQSIERGEQANAAGFESVNGKVAEARTDIVRGQRGVVADLAEGMGLGQVSVEKRFDSIEASLASWRDDSRSTLEKWAGEQSQRFTELQRETHEFGELGRKFERNHTEMVELFQREKQRAEDLEKERRRDQARRVNNSGVSRYHSGDYEGALRRFEQAVELDNQFAEAFNNLGLCLTELGRHEDATVAFETAIELNPDLGASYNNLGYVLYLQENFEAAIEMYKEAIGHEHDTSAAYTNLGNAFQKLDETEKAVDAWKRALEVDPSNERARHYLDRFAGGIPNVVPAKDSNPTVPEGIDDDPAAS